MVDSKLHWFGVPGMANGLSVMRDEETESLWDHISGECFAGPLEGKRLEFWYVGLTNVKAELARFPETILLKSTHRSIKNTLMSKVSGNVISYKNKGTVVLPQFRLTMHGKVDPRLPEGEQGLGLRDELDRAKFYPVALIPVGGAIEDEWLGRKLHIERNTLDGVPFATWVDTGEPPQQLLTRWYGFSFTYPNCEIYSKLSA
jgi:hypothetical protein